MIVDDRLFHAVAVVRGGGGGGYCVEVLCYVFV